ncbi:flavodoxin family protein [Desulfonatronum parangueonense]
MHSSPRKQGNLERLVIRAAQASGHEYKLIRLAELRIFPCTGCVKCAHSKRCVQDDDMRSLYPELERIDGLIMGGVNYNGRVNSLAHVFMERLFPLYHQEPALRDMPTAIVAVGGEAPEKAAQDMADYLKNIYFCNVIGAALFTSDTPPCFSCGLGSECPVGIPALTWKEKDFQSFTRVSKDMFLRFEDNPDAVLAVRRLGETLARSIAGDWDRPRSGGGFYLPSSG